MSQYVFNSVGQTRAELLLECQRIPRPWCALGGVGTLTALVCVVRCEVSESEGTLGRLGVRCALCGVGKRRSSCVQRAEPRLQGRGGSWAGNCLECGLRSRGAQGRRPALGVPAAASSRRPGWERVARWPSPRAWRAGCGVFAAARPGADCAMGRAKLTLVQSLCPCAAAACRRPRRGRKIFIFYFFPNAAKLWETPPSKTSKREEGRAGQEGRAAQLIPHPGISGRWEGLRSGGGACVRAGARGHIFLFFEKNNIAAFFPEKTWENVRELHSPSTFPPSKTWENVR